MVRFNRALVSRKIFGLEDFFDNKLGGEGF